MKSKFEKFMDEYKKHKDDDDFIRKVVGEVRKLAKKSTKQYREEQRAR